MATDFRFNGQQSYSPLLAALANAPVQKAQLAIQQEQNQRQRLSDLLTNISSAASTARQVQLINQQKSQMAGQAAVVDQLRNANQPVQGPGLPTSSGQETSLGTLSQQPGYTSNMMANLAQANPESFATAAGQLPAKLLGINTAFPDEKNIPGNSSTIGGSPLKQMALYNEGFNPQYKESVNPNTKLREFVSPIDGVPTKPIDQSAPGIKTAATQLNPEEKGSLDSLRSKFSENSKTEQEVLLNVKEFRNLAASKNPISDTTLKLLTPRLTGIVARLNPTTLDAFGGSAAILEKINGTIERAKTGKLTDTDRGFLTNFADTVEGSANDALKQKLGDSLTQAKSSAPNVHPSLASEYIAGNTQDRISNYKPMVKAPLSIKDVKAGQTYNGFRYKGGDKSKPSSWVKSR